MGVSTSFKELSHVVNRYESDGGRVRRIEAEMPTQESESGLTATLDVPLSLCSGEKSGTETSPQTATITDDGGVQIEFSGSMLPEIDEYVPEGVSTTKKDARVTDDGTVVATLTLTFEVEEEHQRSEAAASQDRNSQSRPPADTTESDEAIDDDQEPVDASTATVARGEAVDGSDGIDEHEDAQATTVESASGQDEVAEKLDAARSADLPPYEDDDYLQCLYDSFDTFAEMAEHIEMDVASETVRRYMTEAGIHQPMSYATADETEAADETGTDDCTADGSVAAADSDDTVDETDESAAETECPEDSQSTSESTAEQDLAPDEDDPIENVSNTQLAADGLGLPDGLTIEEVVSAIESSMTLYDVQRQLDLNRDRTQKLLKQLDLIDLAMHRLSHDPDREITREEIASRIHSSAISG
ncbi:prolipoprotein diacylglyceryl transferase [Natrinema versiforme]|uniref:Uncharacterized protein n=1 Tax=Natrinema versiforme JCM 10478 TaxID=1227496 RepID=L9XNC4_9EURY|nr:hypothetical protein [Natrinema versiforme]ELY62906.1 hypothetical protein C489_20371 [Natrinema versiforme JCM 10478]